MQEGHDGGGRGFSTRGRRSWLQRTTRPPILSGLMRPATRGLAEAAAATRGFGMGRRRSVSLRAVRHDRDKSRLDRNVTVKVIEQDGKGRDGSGMG